MKMTAFWRFLDLFPSNEGHLLVIPKAHATYLSEMEPDTGMRVFAAAHRLAQAVRECGVRCEGVNLFLADGEAAGQEVFHTHLHVIPRFKGDAFRIRPGGKGMAERADLDRTAGMIRGRDGVIALTGYPGNRRLRDGISGAHKGRPYARCGLHTPVSPSRGKGRGAQYQVVYQPDGADSDG